MTTVQSMGFINKYTKVNSLLHAIQLRSKLSYIGLSTRTVERSTKVDMVCFSPVGFGVKVSMYKVTDRNTNTNTNTSPSPSPKHTISAFVDQTHIQRTRPRRRTVFFQNKSSTVQSSAQMTVSCNVTVAVYKNSKL